MSTDTLIVVGTTGVTLALVGIVFQLAAVSQRLHVQNTILAAIRDHFRGVGSTNTRDPRR